MLAYLEGKNWRRRSDDECREVRIAKSRRELQLEEKRRAQGSHVKLRMERCREMCERNEGTKETKSRTSGGARQNMRSSTHGAARRAKAEHGERDQVVTRRSKCPGQERIQVAPNMEAGGSHAQATLDPEEEEKESQEEEQLEENSEREDQRRAWRSSTRKGERERNARRRRKRKARRRGERKRNVRRRGECEESEVKVERKYDVVEMVMVDSQRRRVHYEERHAKAYSVAGGHASG